MRSRTPIVPSLEGLSVQASPGTGNLGLGVCPGRATYPWRTMLLALAIAGTACRNPSGEASKPGAPAIPSGTAAVSEASGTSAVTAVPSGQQPVPDTTQNTTAFNTPEPPEMQPQDPGTHLAKESPAAAPASAPDGAQPDDEDPAFQATLARVALGDKDWSIRMLAVERLTLQPVLARIALSDVDPDIRKRAVSRMTNQNALAKVATHDGDWSVRQLATTKLTDQAALARITAADEDPDIRKLAVSLLKDQAALARVARGDKEWTVRMAAVEKLADAGVLAQIAMKDHDPDIRKRALGRLSELATQP